MRATFFWNRFLSVQCAAAAAALTLVVASGCGTTREAKWEKVDAENADTEAAAGPLAEGDAAWAERGDQAKLELALAKWEEASKSAPSAELFVKLSRGHYFLGDGYFAVQDNAEKRDEHYTIGLDWAEKALALSAPEFVQATQNGVSHEEAIQKAGEDAVPAMYWYSTNLGKWAASKGFATRIKYKDTVKFTMLRVKELDEDFFYAAPYRYFGAFEAATAGIAGGSLEKSEENFKKSVEMAPNYLGTKVLWADYLAKKNNDRETYERLLNEVVAADPNADPAIAPENMAEQAKAKKMLASIDDVF